jgi:hypothetical protein
MDGFLIRFRANRRFLSARAGVGSIARLSSRKELEARRARTFAAATRELHKVVRLLQRLAETGAQSPRAAARSGEITAADVQAILAARRLRELCLGPEVGDVAWGLLLEAFAARLEGRLVALTSLGAAEGIPRSTAHRWTRWLIDRGLLSGHADPGDDRITLVGLTDDAAERLRSFLKNASSLSRWAA